MIAVDELQQKLFELLDSLGDYTTEHKKESIHILRGRAFLGIHPKRSYLGGNIVLDRPGAIPRAARVERVSANRFHHHYKITGKRQLHKTFARLLKEAYGFARPTSTREIP